MSGTHVITNGEDVQHNGSTVFTIDCCPDGLNVAHNGSTVYVVDCCPNGNESESDMLPETDLLTTHDADHIPHHLDIHRIVNHLVERGLRGDVLGATDLQGSLDNTTDRFQPGFVHESQVESVNHTGAGPLAITITPATRAVIVYTSADITDINITNPGVAGEVCALKILIVASASILLFTPNPGVVYDPPQTLDPGSYWSTDWFTIQPATPAAYSTITGTVTQDSAPVENVSIDVFESDSGAKGQFVGTHLTDNTGAWAATGLLDGPYIITYLAPTGETWAANSLDTYTPAEITLVGPSTFDAGEQQLNPSALSMTADEADWEWDITDTANPPTATVTATSPTVAPTWRWQIRIDSGVWTDDPEHDGTNVAQYQPIITGTPPSGTQVGFDLRVSDNGGASWSAPETLTWTVA